MLRTTGCVRLSWGMALGTYRWISNGPYCTCTGFARERSSSTIRPRQTSTIQQIGRQSAARCAATVTADVSVVTTVFLLRLRHQLSSQKRGVTRTLMAEEFAHYFSLFLNNPHKSDAERHESLALWHGLYAEFCRTDIEACQIPYVLILLVRVLITLVRVTDIVGLRD